MKVPQAQSPPPQRPVWLSPAVPPTPSGESRTWRALRHNPLSMVGIGLITFFLLLAAVGPSIASDPIKQDLKVQLQPPTWNHLCGTDSLGRDVYSRVIVGARYSVPGGFVIVLVAVVVGVLVGSVAGSVGGWTDEILMRVTDLFLAFPALVLAMAIVGALATIDRGIGHSDQSLFHVLAAMAITWWPAYARLVRAEVMRVRQSLFVESARALGVSPAVILWRHILPNCMAPVLVQATLDLGSVILTAAGLSFIGFGAQPPTPEWGAMIFEGQQYLASSWWVVAFPGLAIFLCVMGFNLVGDGLRDALDPRSVWRRP